MLYNGYKMLVQAAENAVKQWVYRPMLPNGVPIEVVTQIEVQFNLNN
jgi:periplasmic protein TonB